MTITAEQLEVKKGRIGASQSAAAVGLSPFDSPMQLALEILGRVPPKEETVPMRMGNIMEPAIAKAYTLETGLEVSPYKETARHPKYDWLVAHPDYFAIDRLIEIKNVGPRQAWRWDKGVPIHVVTQCVHQSMLTQTPRVDVAAYFGGYDLKVFPLTITDKMTSSLLKKLEQFWFDYIEKDIIPPVTAKDLELVKSLYPSHIDEKELTANAGLMETIEKFRAAKIEKTKIEERIDCMEAVIRLSMGDAATLKNPKEGTEFTWRRAKDSEKTDWEAVYQAWEAVDLMAAQSIKKLHTATKPGSRRFLDKFNYKE